VYVTFGTLLEPSLKVPDTVNCTVPLGASVIADGLSTS